MNTILKGCGAFLLDLLLKHPFGLQSRAQAGVISSVIFTYITPYPGHKNPKFVLFLFLSPPCHSFFFSLELKGLYHPILFKNLCSNQMRLKYKMPANFGYPIRDIIYLIFLPVYHSALLGLVHAKWVILFSPPDSKVSKWALVIWRSQLIIASWGNSPYTVESLRWKGNGSKLSS